MRLEDFDYSLPAELIAQTPAKQRSASRLMVVDRRAGSTAHHRFSDLPELLPSHLLLVLNNSRVFPARLIGRKPSGARVEVLLLRQLSSYRWTTLLKPTRKLRAGERLIFEAGRVEAIREDRDESVGPVLRFESQVDLRKWVWRHGLMPLPPYIKRPGGETQEDRERYQTVYSAVEGSVAAPTAGLHFTAELLRRVPHEFVTLHVGYGTFQPVRAANLRDHRMHAEPFEVSADVAQRLNSHRAAGGGLAAVGTTTTRVLESSLDPSGKISPGQGETDMFIRPGYRFRSIDALITNLHLPKSTLLMLVAAFAGREFILECYQEAVRRKYRFFSYGDAMLIL